MSVEELKLRAVKNHRLFEAPAPKAISTRLAGFLFATILLVLCFAFPLYGLLKLAVSDDLYSDIPLIPLVSLYLVWIQRKNLPHSFKPASMNAAVSFIAGLLVMAAYWIISRDILLSAGSYLSFNILAFLCFFIAICFFFFGELFMRAVAFPTALLIFIIPLPDILRQQLEAFLQSGSAAFAEIFFQCSGIPALQEGLNFHLPGCVIQVAPECSGIHSTLVLAITSLIGGWLFLRSGWRRTTLALAVIPLALFRNGFRIFVIGWLCATRGPQMLASPIHRHGGPLFFILSLIPLFSLLLFLRKTESMNLEPPPKKML